LDEVTVLPLPIDRDKKGREEKTTYEDEKKR